MKKKKCIRCLLPYPETETICPHCQYEKGLRFFQPYVNALPLCSIVDFMQIGFAFDISENSFGYIGYDTKKNRRVLIREFFAHGYVQRENDHLVLPGNPSYLDTIEQKKAAFCRAEKKTFSANGTVYSVRPLHKKTVKFDHKAEENINLALRSILGARSNQEDKADCVLYPNGTFAVLCDGMGGTQAGEVASNECVRKMIENAHTLVHCDPGIIPSFFYRLIVEADNYVSSLKDLNNQPLRCGTTLLCSLVRDNRFYFASVGDSHIYLLRDHTIQLVTEEHNYLTDLLKMVDSGEMDYEEAVCHPKRDALTSYIGIGHVQKIHISSEPIVLTPGDRILLCSDGLYRTLNDEILMQIIMSSQNTEEAADMLIRAVTEQNLPRQDNCTLILYQHSSK